MRELEDVDVMAEGEMRENEGTTKKNARGGESTQKHSYRTAESVYHTQRDRRGLLIGIAVMGGGQSSMRCEEILLF